MTGEEQNRHPVYMITRDAWKAIPDGYKMTTDDGTRATFKCFLTPDHTGGAALCFKHQHFRIIDGPAENSTE